MSGAPLPEYRIASCEGYLSGRGKEHTDCNIAFSTHGPGRRREEFRTNHRDVRHKRGCEKYQTASLNAHEVNRLSPHHRPVIALHSPDGVAETGPGVCRPEKKTRKLDCGIRRDTFSGAV